MEHIYKIKIRSNPDPRGLYPSERRYSASTVLGLSVVHISLAITALLMASLNLSSNKINESGNGTVIIIDLNPNLSVSPCVMSLGALAAGLAGLLAWKRWYIDNNIRWFFLSTIISTLTSVICVVMITVTIVTAYEKHRVSYELSQQKPNVRFILALNILIASILELIWSILSSKVAYVGMMKAYPDDIVISKSRGKIEVNTVHKGNIKNKVVPPDIIDHFPKTGKLAKYLPKSRDNINLPNDESNAEYQERVRQFLSANSCDNSIIGSEFPDVRA